MCFGRCFGRPSQHQNGARRAPNWDFVWLRFGKTAGVSLSPSSGSESEAVLARKTKPRISRVENGRVADPSQETQLDFPSLENGRGQSVPAGKTKASLQFPSLEKGRDKKEVLAGKTRLDFLAQRRVGVVILTKGIVLDRPRLEKGPESNPRSIVELHDKVPIDYHRAAVISQNMPLVAEVLSC